MKSISDLDITNAIEPLRQKILESGSKDPASTSTSSVPEHDAKLRELYALECLWTSLQAFVPRQIAYERRHKNTYSLINKLPRELIVLILELSVEYLKNHMHRSYHHYYSRIRKLAAVCSSWAGIVKDTPVFWTLLPSAMDIPRLQHILARSGNCPLSVHLHKYGPEFQDSEEYPSRFLSITSPHIARWSHAEIALRNFELLKALEAPAPRLQEAAIHFGSRETVKWVALDLFCGEAKSLEKLRLGGVPIRWTSGIVSNLRVLELNLNRVPEEFLPSGLDMEKMLSSCSHTLEKLRIVEPVNSPESATSTNGSSGSTLGFPYLYALELSGKPASTIRIFSRASMPSLNRLDLVLTASNGDPTALSSPFTPSTQRAIR